MDFSYLSVLHVDAKHGEHNTRDVAHSEASHIEYGYLAIPTAVRFIGHRRYQSNVGHHEEHLNCFGEIKLKCASARKREIAIKNSCANVGCGDVGVPKKKGFKMKSAALLRCHYYNFIIFLKIIFCYSFKTTPSPSVCG